MKRISPTDSERFVFGYVLKQQMLDLEALRQKVAEAEGAAARLNRRGPAIDAQVAERSGSTRPS